MRPLLVALSGRVPPVRASAVFVSSGVTLAAWVGLIFADPSYWWISPFLLVTWVLAGLHYGQQVTQRPTEPDSSAVGHEEPQSC